MWVPTRSRMGHCAPRFPPRAQSLRLQVGSATLAGGFLSPSTSSGPFPRLIESSSSTWKTLQRDA